MASAILKPSTRVLILFVIVESGLAGLWWYLLQALRTGELRPAKSLAETVGNGLHDAGRRNGRDCRRDACGHQSYSGFVAASGDGPCPEHAYQQDLPLAPGRGSGRA